MLLFTTGASSVQRLAMMGNAGPARDCATTRSRCTTALAAEGIYAAHVALDLLIQSGGGEADPDALVERCFELYERRDQPEIKVGNHIEQALANTSA